MGMILAAKGDQMLNCIKEAPARRYWTAPKPAPVPTVGDPAEPIDGKEVVAPVPEPVEEPEPVQIPDEEKPIEDSVIAAQDEGPSVFDEPTPEEIKEYKEKKAKGAKAPKQPRQPRQPRPRPQFTWFKHIQNSFSEGMGKIFESMENEEI